MTDPLEPIRNIGKAIKRVTDPMGLEVMNYGVVPGETADDQDFVDVMFRVKPEALMSEDEKQAAADKKAFDDMMAGQDFSDPVPEVTPAQERAAAQAQEILKKLKGGEDADGS